MRYYGFRYYNPSTGRWPNRDPIEELGHAAAEADFSFLLELMNEIAVIKADILRRVAYLRVAADTGVSAGVDFAMLLERVVDDQEYLSFLVASLADLNGMVSEGLNPCLFVINDPLASWDYLGLAQRGKNNVRTTDGDTKADEKADGERQSRQSKDKKDPPKTKKEIEEARRRKKERNKRNQEQRNNSEVSEGAVTCLILLGAAALVAVDGPFPFGDIAAAGLVGARFAD